MKLQPPDAHPAEEQEEKFSRDSGAGLSGGGRQQPAPGVDGCSDSPCIDGAGELVHHSGAK